MAALLTGVGLAGFNWLVDPYRIFGSPKIAGLNDIKTKLADHERIFKTTNLLKQNPEVAFLGTSRTDIGLSPLHEIFAGKKTINLAVSSQPYEESEMLFSHLDPKNFRRVIFGMDFLSQICYGQSLPIFCQLIIWKKENGNCYYLFGHLKIA